VDQLGCRLAKQTALVLRLRGACHLQTLDLHLPWRLSGTRTPGFQPPFGWTCRATTKWFRPAQILVLVLSKSQVLRIAESCRVASLQKAQLEVMCIGESRRVSLLNAGKT